MHQGASNSPPGHNRHEHAMTLKIIQKSHSSPLIIFIHWRWIRLCKLQLSFSMRRNTTKWRQSFLLSFFMQLQNKDMQAKGCSHFFFLIFFINSTTILQANDCGGYDVKYNVSQLLYKNESILIPCFLFKPMPVQVDALTGSQKWSHKVSKAL